MTWHPRILTMLRKYPNDTHTPDHLRPNKLMTEAADRIEELETQLAMQKPGQEAEQVERAAQYIAKTVMRYEWKGLRESSCIPDYPAWTVGGHANAGKEDYRNVVREIAAILRPSPDALRARAEAIEEAAEVASSEARLCEKRRDDQDDAAGALTWASCAATADLIAYRIARLSHTSGGKEQGNG